MSWRAFISPGLSQELIRAMTDQTQMVGPEHFLLCCAKCPREEMVEVGHFTQLYAAMDRRGWALIPTQHGQRVLGVCWTCQVKDA